jgi:hypothetical protein
VHGGLTLRPEPVSLVAGVAIAALGALLVLDRTGALNLDWGWLAAALAGAAGVILVVSGLSGREAGGGAAKRHD